MRFATLFLAGLVRVERLTVLAAFVVMTISLFLDVMLRETRGHGLIGAANVGVFAMIVVAMIGIGLASTAGTHLRPRFFDGLVPKRHDASMNRVADLLTAVFCAYFAWLGVITVGEAMAQGDVNPELRWPIWPFQAVIPLAFWIAALRHGLFALFPDLAPRPTSPEQAELAAHQASDPVAFVGDADGAPIVSEPNGLGENR